MSMTWAHRVDLTPQSRLHLQRFIIAERGYYNMLLDGLAAPIRTMPETVRQFTGGKETLLSVIAASRTDLSRVKFDAFPAHLDQFRDLIIKDGRVAIDPKTMLIFDLVRREAGIHPHTRAGLAIEMIRYAREQVNAFSTARVSGPNKDDMAHKFSIRMLTPLDEQNKRHIQLPKSAITATVFEDSGKSFLSLQIPYLDEAVIIPAPSREWNYFSMRLDNDGRAAVELTNETSRYLLRRFDQVMNRKAKQGGKIWRQDQNYVKATRAI